MNIQTKNKLLALIKKKASSENLSLIKLSNKLSVSASYISQLDSGQKSMEGVKNDFIRKCADYLELPAISCFIASGKILATDFYSPKAMHKEHLDRALQCVADNSISLESGVSERQLFQLSDEVKMLIVLLYQSAFSVQVLPKCFNRSQWNENTGIRIPFSTLK